MRTAVAIVGHSFSQPVSVGIYNEADNITSGLIRLIHGSHMSITIDEESLILLRAENERYVLFLFVKNNNSTHIFLCFDRNNPSIRGTSFGSLPTTVRMGLRPIVHPDAFGS